MIQLDPIMSVADVEKSASWYQQIFGFKNAHGGKDFAVLTDTSDQIVLCLHQWGGQEHPTMMDRSIVAGNGLLFYFRTNNMEGIRSKLEEAGWPVEEEIHRNSNSTKMEFSQRDPDGYFLTITEFHQYEG